MHVYTRFGYVQIGALSQLCWARPWISDTENKPYGAVSHTCYENPKHYLQREDGKIVGVCEKHRVELESKGWKYLGESKRHPHVPFEDWDTMSEEEKKWLWD